MIRRPPRSTRTDTLFSLHDALPIYQFLGAPRTPRDVRLLIFRRTEHAPQLIGVAGLGRSFSRTEFGLWLARAERRRGFAQEAGRAILSLAFSGLRLNSVWTLAVRDGAADRKSTRLNSSH